MENILEYSKWVSSSTSGPNIKVDVSPIEKDLEKELADVSYSYKSKDKTYWGIHKIELTSGGKSTMVTAKFDTGARTSSIDIGVAKRLGISDKIIEATKELDKIKVEKTISKEDEKALEESLSKEYKEKYGCSSVMLIKNATGFSARLCINMTIIFDGRIINTEVNIKDRKGMNAEMLVGLKDML